MRGCLLIGSPDAPIESWSDLHQAPRSTNQWTPSGVRQVNVNPPSRRAVGARAQQGDGGRRIPAATILQKPVFEEENGFPPGEETPPNWYQASKFRKMRTRHDGGTTMSVAA